MIRFEAVEPDLDLGLDIARDAYRDDALRIGKELEAIPEHVWLRGASSFDRLDRLVGHEASVVISILKEIAENFITCGDEIRATVNRYAPHSAGVWHPDYTPLLPVYVLGLTDIEEPSFNYARQLAYDKRGVLAPGDDIAGLQFSAGDLVKVSGRRLMHRGFNPTDDYRYVGVFHSFNPSAF